MILPAVQRREVGTTAAAVRGKGFVPAIVYGHGVANLQLAVDRKVFVKLLPGLSSSTLLTLALPGAESRRVLISEVQADPLSGEPIHVDFHQVRLTEKIRAKVPLVPKGVSLAVKNLSGVLVQSIDDIEVEALPQDLPSELAVDLGKLATFEDKVTLADLAVPAGVEVHAKPDEVVAVVMPPKTEEELKAELEAPAAPAPAEVKTEAEEKKAAEEAKRAEEAQAEGTRQKAEGTTPETKREAAKPEGRKEEKK